jgi:hypothetical protein
MKSHNERIMRSMPDEAEGNGGAAAASKRKAVSKREYLLADGSVAERIEDASGARYTLLGGADGNIDFDELFANEKFKTMCAIFGFHTKAGNVANTVLNDKSDPGTPDDAADAIREFIAGGYDGTWAERTGGVGVKIDKDQLAGAIVDAYQKATPPKVVDYSKARELLEEPANVRKFRQVPEIAAEYNKRVGKAPKTLDEMAADLA